MHFFPLFVCFDFAFLLFAQNKQRLNFSLFFSICLYVWEQYYTPKGFKKIPAPAYYVHCIDDCPEYRAKGQIKECEVCSFKFLDKQSLGIHKNSCRATNKRAMLARKPKWMPYSILLTIINYSRFDGKIDCRGCKKKFPCVSTIQS